MGDDEGKRSGVQSDMVSPTRHLEKIWKAPGLKYWKA